MYQFILLIHVFLAIFIVALVLVQQGRGATVGAAFGSGASQTVFGSRGSGSFLFRLTLSIAMIFFITSIGLNYLVTRAQKQQHVLSVPAVPATPSKSAKPAETPASSSAPVNNIPASIPAQTMPIEMPTTPAAIPEKKI